MRRVERKKSTREVVVEQECMDDKLEIVVPPGMKNEGEKRDSRVALI